MDCRQAEPLIPSYLDGELSEVRAAPLRRHLLDCQPCRAGAQGEKNLKRWFTPAAAAVIPQGFAARVARRAFAGDVGEGQPGGLVLQPQSAPSLRAVGSEERNFQFVLALTAAAALLVIALAVSMRSWSLPSGTSLRATDGREQISVEEAIERLDHLNRAELARPVADRRP
ncbi:MAG: zf-HC2 domain-containing protein [Planctomycetota bacterium]